MFSINVSILVMSFIMRIHLHLRTQVHTLNILVYFTSKDATNKMFVMFDFIKSKESVKLVPSNQLEGLSLKPCIYKKR